MKSGAKLVIKIVKPKSPRFPVYQEEDPFYLEGKNEVSIGFVRNLLLQTDFSDEKIASIANVSLAFVIEVKKTLEKPKS